MRKYIYTWVSLYERHVEYWFVLYKHDLWTDSFLKDYLMVLPYLKCFLYILVYLFLWMNLDILLSRVYFLCRFTTNRESTSGYVFHLGSGPTFWSCKNNKMVSILITIVEYWGAIKSCIEAIWIHNLLNEVIFLVGE